ncbi:mitotic apparatus p62 [Fusarium mundagurra]|uniref:Mitotic apparatus p62 n=1 Tax=Fusarium mundagurra TaxID=1567541 RepID=A0A8H5XVM0_9HYPO|nr:mitotic apparatus p62 [Fusarium mundagurra]
MASQARVLKFPRSDNKSSFVLLQATPNGSKRLDLKLVGTEGEEPYVASLKHDKVVSLRVKNCPASESEWQRILEDLFQQEPLLDIQATATVQSDKSISITIRKDIQGITQRLGSITLDHAPDEGIELFDWCGAAVEASASSKQTAADLSAKSSESEAVVAQLQLQLEELIKAKDEDETALLRKFRDLLNEKKLKIREQQQALNILSTNPSIAGQFQRSQAVEASVQQPKPKKPTRQAGKSRASKRKAPASRRLDESDDDDAVDTMSVDLKQEAVDTDPGNTTEATASGDSDDEDDDGLDSRPPQQNKAPDTVSRGKTASKESERPPPPRALPFETKKSTKAAPVPAPAGSDTESDDEL